MTNEADEQPREPNEPNEPNEADENDDGELDDLDAEVVEDLDVDEEAEDVAGGFYVTDPTCACCNMSFSCQLR
jgi:hypothetical protein